MIDYNKKLKLSKISDNSYQDSTMKDIVIGKLAFELLLHRVCIFRMENYKFRKTSRVIEITELDDSTIFKTENSTYKLKEYNG